MSYIYLELSRTQNFWIHRDLDLDLDLVEPLKVTSQFALTKSKIQLTIKTTIANTNGVYSQ